MFDKMPYIMEFEKVSQVDMTIETINISVQGRSRKECEQMFDHILALR